MDMGSILAAGQSLKLAADIAKGLIHIKSDTDVQAKVIELQSAILAAQSSALSAQSEQSAMLSQISNLEKEIAKVKAWEETKQRYKLISPRWGIFFLALKEECKGTEPPHWLCATCYEKGIKSIVQDNGNPYTDKMGLVCHSCGAEIKTGDRLEVTYAK